MLLKKKQSGQGMTEYIIIVALIAIAGIAAFKFFGGTVQSQVGGISQELSGKDGKKAIKNSQSSAKSAEKEGKDLEDMGTYSGNNK